MGITEAEVTTRARQQTNLRLASDAPEYAQHLRLPSLIFSHWMEKGPTYQTRSTLQISAYQQTIWFGFPLVAPEVDGPWPKFAVSQTVWKCLKVVALRALYL